MPRVDPGTGRERHQLLIVLLLATLTLMFVSFTGEFDNWNATHWLFTYENGFIKRGLVGTFHLGVFGHASPTTLSYLHGALASVTSLVFAFLVFSTLAKSIATSGRAPTEKALPIAAVLGVFLLSGPGVVQQFVFDRGRFDAFGILLLVASFWTIRRYPAIPALIAGIACAALAIVIHEAMFFWVAPMGLGLWIWTNGTSARNLAGALFALFLLAMLAALVGGATYSDLFSFEIAREMLQGRADFSVSDASLMVHYRDFSENLAYAAANARGTDHLIALGVGAAFIGVNAALVVSVGARGGRRVSLRGVLLFLSGFAPLVLLALGEDQGRWLAMINCNLAIVLLAVMDEDPGRLASLTWRQAGYFLIAILAQVGLGPFGDNTVFPDAAFWDMLLRMMLARMLAF